MSPLELRQMTEQHRPRRPSNFLSLAPSMSDSYPRQKPAIVAEKLTPLTADALAEIPKKEGASMEVTKRRTSSLSSDGSKVAFRFLRLGPVHYGEHQDETKGDFFEVAVE
ncbi:hypothetical protein B0H67DRAFT_597294 [Lasiosphaeris hirsuta]|uniref:Uncharacterized protein n=1 Tax=Lasiosphaeris hirsuta TaxID=260670 RepID=A0AA40BBW0_9PEZI|nr:hypothetical protein B0H67DRAFT_597294 [Lasiosphaeris hirsuta]